MKSVVNIHNVRFYNLLPRSINCISYNSLNGKIALSRIDSSIEIWDVTHAPVLEKSILCQANKGISIEDLCWFGERLFSGDLAGKVIEYNTESLSEKKYQYTTGNSIWCLDVSHIKNHLAAGTEEGYLNIFDLNDNNFIYKTVFDKQDGRILCCKFSFNGDFIVTGSLDVIRIWSTKTGNAIRKISTGRSEKKKETIVWTIQVLQDFTIISGDSRGQITVWDGNTGIQLESHQVFQKDILTLSVNEKQNLLVCAGVEPVIRIYCLTPITRSNQTLKRWVKFLQRHVHDHDIKSVLFADSNIISGGIDGFLGVSSLSKIQHEIKKYGPFLQNPCVDVAQNVRQILLRYPNYLEIWKLAKNNESTAEKLLEIKSKNGDFIISAAFNPDGDWLCYSTDSNIRLFSLAYENNTLFIKKIKKLSTLFSPSIKIFFSYNVKQIFLLNKDKHINVFNLSIGTPIFKEKIDFSYYIKEHVHIAILSKDGSFLVLGSTCKSICIWRKQESWKYYVTLPQYAAPVTAMQLNSVLPLLIATYSDGKIFEYNILEKKFVKSKMLFDANFASECIKSILLHDNMQKNIFLQTENTLFSCEWDENLETEFKRRKDHSCGSKAIDNYQIKISLCKSYDNLVQIEWLSQNEIISVAVNPVSLIEVLPNAFKRKVFGTS